MLRRLCAVALVLCASCAPAPDEQGSAQRSSLSVAAAVYPLFEAAQRVGGGEVSVTNLTPPGVEPHDLELTTAQLDAIMEADLLVYLGQGFQPAIEEAAARMRGHSIDALEDIQLIEGEEHKDAHGNDDEDGHGDEEAADPHVWLDPRRMTEIITRIESTLIELDPEGEEGYAARAEAYRAELEALDRSFEEGLSDCERDLIVTNHASFGYLTDRYGLQQEAIFGLSPESEPDPARLAELSDLVEAEGVTTVFTETLASPRVAETLAREAGVKVAVLDPLEGLAQTEIDQGRTYLTVMQDNLTALRTALGCR